MFRPTQPSPAPQPALRWAPALRLGLRLGLGLGLGLVCAAGCWAPQLASPGPGDDEAERPLDQPPGIDPSSWPRPPFAAWTVRAPATLVAAGGAAVVQIQRTGVLVEVLQVLPVRARLRCLGCEGEESNTEGWLQTDALWWPGLVELPADSPLALAQALRHAAAEGELTIETANGVKATADELCALLDGGWTGTPPRWHLGSTSLSTEYIAPDWRPPRLVGQPRSPYAAAEGACRRTQADGIPTAPAR